jgi:hypothetical protein
MPDSMWQPCQFLAGITSSRARSLRRELNQSVDDGNLEPGFLTGLLNLANDVVPLLNGQSLVLHVEDRADAAPGNGLLQLGRINLNILILARRNQPISSWVIWPIFSSSVIRGTSASTRRVLSRAGTGAQVTVWKKASLSLTSARTGPLVSCGVPTLCCRARQKMGAHIMMAKVRAVFSIVIRYVLD